MTDKVLKDPRQKRFFKAKDLSDLFTLGDEYAQGTDTAEIFSSIGASANIDAAEILEEPKDNTNIQGQNPTMSCVNDDHENDAGQQEGDAFILKELFDQAGMHSALDHDKIEGAYKPENNIAKKEAKNFYPDVKAYGNLVLGRMKAIGTLDNKGLKELLKDLEGRRTNRIYKLKAAFQRYKLT